jgi:hypothetical protein
LKGHVFRNNKKNDTLINRQYIKKKKCTSLIKNIFSPGREVLKITWKEEKKSLFGRKYLLEKKWGKTNALLKISI